MSTLVVDALTPVDKSVTLLVKDIPQLTSAAVVADGLTDNTLVLQAALDAGGVVHLPVGVIKTGPLTIPAGGGLVASVTGGTTLKALDSSQIRLVTITGAGSQFRGINLVGMGTSIVGDFRNGLLTVQDASDFDISDISITTAPNLGAMFHNCVMGIRRGRVRNLVVKDTGWKGVVVFSPCSSIDFAGVEQSNSIGNHGFSFEPYTWSSIGNVTYVDLCDAYIHDNPAGFGLFTFGLIGGGNSFVDFYYTFGEQALRHCRFERLRLDGNYTGGILGGSYCQYSDISADDNWGSAGVVIQAHRSSFLNIAARGNKVYGIDMGGASYCSVHNITCTGNNPAGDFCIALNVGGCIGCTVNGGVIADNGLNNANCTALVLTGKEGDGTYAYAQTGGFNRISNLYLRGTLNQYAIRAWRADAGSVIENCTVEGFNTQTCIENRTVNNHVPVHIRNITIPAVDYAEAGVVIPSATQLVIPDHAEFVYVTGSTSITGIATQGQTSFANAVNDVIPVSFGSGYLPTDTVTFTGNGTGATGTVDIARASGGAVVSINVTNKGSGYTTASVSINSSTGSGFVGEVILGANNCKERVITLFFESALSIQVTGMNSAFNAAAGSTLTLRRMANGSWAEVSRAA